MISEKFQINNGDRYRWEKNVKIDEIIFRLLDCKIENVEEKIVLICIDIFTIFWIFSGKSEKSQ